VPCRHSSPDQAIQLPRRAGDDDHTDHKNWSDVVAAKVKQKKKRGSNFRNFGTSIGDPISHDGLISQVCISQVTLQVHFSNTGYYTVLQT
jgi:hypothetical protein